MLKGSKYNVFIMFKKHPIGVPIHYIESASVWKKGDKEYGNVLDMLMDVKCLMSIDSRNVTSEIIRLSTFIKEKYPL